MNGKSKIPRETLFTNLKELMPEIYSEGKIDWEKLKATLGGDINFSNERYVLNWAGKSDAFRILQSPTTKTLIPVREESVNFDKTENIFIEGENLEVLKVLQKSYFSKIKMIYIDPPYNTGNDSFIYPDKFSETREDYQKRIGDKDEEGYMTREGMFRKNSRENGQYHSNWLNMMYPRLFLARNLLRDDGVIFVSIDDNEVHNLRLLMNEIFGEENFICQFIIQSNPRGSQSIKHAAIVHEYILSFSKCIDLANPLWEQLDERMKKEYNQTDSDGKSYRLLGLRQRGGAWRRTDRPKLYYPIYVDPSTERISLERSSAYSIEVYPIKPSTNEEGSWRWSKEKVINNINYLISKKIQRNNNEEWDIYQIDYLESENGDEKRTKSKTIWIEKDINYQNASEEIKYLFNGKNFFDFPKPKYLLRKLLLINNITENEIVLDFFSGSGTLAHSALDLNKDDGANRKFICVQLPEKTEENSEAYKAGYKTIADIAKERIRLVINKIEKEKEEKLDFNPNNKQDLGFKVLKLSDSNFKVWRMNEINSAEELEKQMEIFTDPVSQEAQIENMVYELLLKSGFDINSKIEHRNNCFIINENEMILLLEEVNQALVNEVMNLKPSKIIALDKLFEGNDQLKTNTALQLKDAGIDFKTI